MCRDNEGWGKGSRCGEGGEGGRPATLRGGDGVVDDEEQEEAASSALGLLYTARPGYMQIVQAPL